MVEWHHQLNGHEFEQAPGVGDGQGGLACCNPWSGLTHVSPPHPRLQMLPAVYLLVAKLLDVRQ